MRRVLLPLTAFTVIALAATPALAQRWGYPGASPYGWGGPFGPVAPRDRSREGKVEVTRFLANGASAQALGHGSIAVAARQGRRGRRTRAGDVRGGRDRSPRRRRLRHRRRPAGDGGQTVELHVLHAEVEPAEAPHKPVSGAMSLGVDSRGGRYAGLGIGIDMRKPLPALISTRLEARIRDKASGTVLWEGRADMATREGDPKWTDQAIATKLADALFSGFPGKNGETIAAG